MAGSLVVTTREITNNIIKYSLVWTSDASGNVSGIPFDMTPGTIITVEFIPGAGGVQPTDLYDVELRDAEGITMFDDGAGTTIGANLSNVAASHKLSMVGLVGVTIYRRWHHGGPATLEVSNAGNAKSGTANIFVMQGVL